MASIQSRKHAPLPSLGTPTALATTLAALMLPALAQAQSAPAEPAAKLPPVRVQGEVDVPYKPGEPSSPKFSQPLLETPQTITVLKKELLQDQGATTLSQALRNTPGITFTLGENGNTATGDAVFMRGFDTANSIFVDGIRDLGTVTRDIFNLEQVEIVKGPSGSDNGRGAPSGYINLSSKQPLAEELSAGTLTVGSDRRLRATADLNRRLDGGGSLPGAALRLNVMSDRGDAPGRDGVDHRSVGIAPSLALGLGTPTRAVLSFLHVDQDNTPDGGLPTLGLRGYNHVASSTTFPDAAQRSAIQDAVNAARRVDSSNFYGSKSDHDRVQANMLTLKVEHDFSPSTTLRNTTRWGRTDQEQVLTGVNALGNLVDASGAVNDPALWTVARSRQGKDVTNEIFVNQTHLQTAFVAGGLKHTLGTGIELLHERQRTLGYVFAPDTTAANLYDPSTSDLFGTGRLSGADTEGSTRTAAVYAFDNIELSPQWELNAGLRWERYSTRTRILAAPSGTPPTQTFTQLDKSDTLISGKLGLVRKFGETGTVYATYATAQQPPGGANFTLSATAANIANPNLDPQKAQTVEIGSKWELLDHRLVLSAAAYRTRNENELATTDPVSNEVVQYGRTTVKGLELGMAGALSADWQINAGLALMDTEVSQGTATSQGSSVRFSPKSSFTFWTTYQPQPKVNLGFGGRYLSKQETQANNGSAGAVSNLQEIPSSWVFDAMGSYAIHRNATLQLNINNLTDTFYVASVNNGRSRYILGAERSVQLSLLLNY